MNHRTLRFAAVAIFLMAGAVPGNASLAFLGLYAEGRDAFTIGLLAPLQAGATIRFRDDEWDGSAFNSDGNVADTSFSFQPTSSLPAGAILHFMDVNGEVPLSVTDGFGSPIAGTVGGERVLNLSTSNEGLYAYFGPTFDVVEAPLASIRTGGSGGSLFGIGVDFAGLNDSSGNQAGNSLVYSGPVDVAGPHSLYAELIAGPTNWSILDASPLSPYTPPQGQLQAVSAVPEPGLVAWGLGATLLAGSLGWRRRSLT